MDFKHPCVFQRQVSQDADLIFSTSVETVEVIKKQLKQGGRQDGSECYAQ